MLNVYSVAFFGHRHIENVFEVTQKLQRVIRELMSENEYVEFLVGRNGEFDVLSASGVKTAKKEYRNDNSSLCLILPYTTAEVRDNRKAFYDYFDEIEVCKEAEEAHRKASITIRNRKMAERANCIICYIDHKSGGAYAAVKYAEKLGKKIINLAEK